MEEDEREGHESQPEPEQPVPEDAGQEEQPEEIQPVPESEAAQEQAEQERDLQPAPATTPGQPPLTSKERRRQFLIGLGIGFIPLVLFFIGFAPNVGWLITLSIILWLLTLIASIGFIFNPRLRQVGYGLLTSVPISLVVASIGCIIIISRPPA